MAPAKTQSLLIVEDDPVDREAVKRCMESQALPYAYTYANSLAEARDHLESSRFDLVLSDYNLGDGTALELSNYFQQLPFIFTTGQGDEAIAVEVLKAGALDYLVKDIGRSYLQILPTTIEKALHYWEGQEKLRLLESVVLNANDAILITEATSLELPGPRIIYTNEGFTRMTGYAPDEVLGKTPRLMQGPDTDRSELDRIKTKLAEGKDVSAELVNYHRSGEPYWVDVHIVPVKNGLGEITHFIAIQRDITKKKASEMELIRAKERAEKAEKAEREFLANMSHEIRNPIHAIAGMTDLLLRSDLDARQIELVHSINYSSTLLSSLVADILDFSKIESGEIFFQKKPVDLNHTIASIAKMYQFTQKDKPVTLHYTVDPEIPAVIGDLTRLNQILINLIGNAVKFTEEGEVNIRSQLKTTTEKECLVEISVSDTGIGIPDDQLNSIFKRFKQSRHSISKGVSGTGLGLAIASQLVDLQGGKIWVESREGRGSTFYFQLPFQKLEANASSSEKRAAVDPLSEAFKNITILVAEDNPMNQRLIRLLLEEWGISFDLAPNGKVALNLLTQEKAYDLILMDMHMPKLDGFECTKRLRNGDSRNKQVPVIALTASLFSEDKNRAAEIGITEILPKPFEPEELYQLIRRYAGASVHSSLLDLSYLKRVARSNKSFVTEMLQIFLDMTPEALHDMRLSTDSQDAEQLHQIAHKMRSTFRIIGNQALIELIVLVDQESAEETPDWLSLKQKVDQIIELCEQAIPEVEEAITKL